MTLRPLISAHRASRLLSLPGKVIEAEFRRQGWPVYKAGRRTRFAEDDLARFQAQMALEHTPEAEAERLDIIVASVRQEFGYTSRSSRAPS